MHKYFLIMRKTSNENHLWTSLFSFLQILKSVVASVLFTFDAHLKAFQNRIQIKHSLLDWNTVISEGPHNYGAVAYHCPYQQYVQSHAILFVLQKYEQGSFHIAEIGICPAKWSLLTTEVARDKAASHPPTSTIQLGFGRPKPVAERHWGSQPLLHLWPSLNT